jgi:hypothetical protein
MDGGKQPADKDPHINGGPAGEVTGKIKDLPVFYRIHILPPGK